MKYCILLVVLVINSLETNASFYPNFYYKRPIKRPMVEDFSVGEVKKAPITKPPQRPVKKDENLEDIICPSSCEHLMENGYFLKKDVGLLKKLCASTVKKYSPNCSTQALGMEDGDIPDSSITASSYHYSIYKPEQGRLNYKGKEIFAPYGNGNEFNEAWEPSEPKYGEWIQVDLRQDAKVTAVATQGNGKSDLSEWTTSYTLKYSSDGQRFEDYDGGRVFPGNKDRNTVVKNRIDPPIVARFIRIVPETWHNWNGLRMELYGCSQDVFDDLQSVNDTCNERPLGMESGAISDSSITASSYYANIYYPYEARLYNTFKNRLATGSWFVSFDKPGSWIQVDLGNITTVSGIATQGKASHGWYGAVTSYKLAYSNDGQVFEEYLKGKVFDGNTDRHTVVRHDLLPVFKARYVRLYPQTWGGDISLRMELYGCKTAQSKKTGRTCPPGLWCRR